MLIKIFSIVIAVFLSFTQSSNALASFADLELIRVYYDRSGAEYGTDLGNIKNILASSGPQTFSGSFTGSNGTALYAVYFALDRTNNDLWASNSTSTAPMVIGQSTGLTSMNAGTTFMYAHYNIQGGTNHSGLAADTNSYMKKLSSSQGWLGNTITGVAARAATELDLSALTSNNTQLLYYWDNAKAVTTDIAGRTGIAVATITTNADGSTTITPNADTTRPTVNTFEIPASSSNRYTVDGINFAATDNSGVVSAYLITESDTPPTTPLFNNAGWSTTLPTSYTIPAANLPAYGVPTTKTLYAWARDLYGNISNTQISATVDILAVDTTPPVITLSTPTPPVGTSITDIVFTATDDNGTVSGYLLNDTGLQPAVNAPEWSSVAPNSFTFVTNLPAPGVTLPMTLYAWAKDDIGNISGKFIAVDITGPAGDTAPPITTIKTTSPLSATSATVTIDISATDDTGVTAYQLTESATPPTADNVGWVAITPATNTGSMPVSHQFSGIVPDTLTPKTLFAWTKDAAGNISAEKSIPVNITIPVLTVTIVNATSDISNNPGGGEISSDKGGISCPTGNVCNAAFDSVAITGPVTLSAVPNTDSSFTGWRNNVACDGLTGPCVLTMVTSQGVTATFDRLKLVRTTDGITPKGYFGRVQNALKSAADGDIIQLTKSPFNESLTFDQVIGSDVVTIAGGYDPGFTTPPNGFTSIQGTLFIKNGKLIADGIAIRP